MDESNKCWEPGDVGCEIGCDVGCDVGCEVGCEVRSISSTINTVHRVADED